MNSSEIENFVDSSEHNSSDEDGVLLKGSQPENFVSFDEESSDDDIRNVDERVEKENFVDFESSDEETKTGDIQGEFAINNININSKIGLSNVQNSLDPSVEILVTSADEDMGLVVTEAVEEGMCIIEIPTGDMLIVPTGRACTCDIVTNSFGDMIITCAGDDGLDLVIVDDGDMMITKKPVDDTTGDTTCHAINGIGIVVTTSADLLISEDLDIRFVLIKKGTVVYIFCFQNLSRELCGL